MSKSQASSEFRRGRSVVFAIHVHLVFVTKRRRKALDSASIDRLRDIFTAVCKDFSSELMEMDGEQDHVHLLVSLPPKIAVSHLVNSLKGVSSRYLREERPDLLRWRAFRHALWSPSYFVASCGGAPLAAVKRYIQQQQTPA